MSPRRSAATRFRRQMATGFVHPKTSAAAGGLARAVAGAAENAGENVRLAVEHVGVGVPALRDQPDVFGHIGVRGTSPLAIDNFMKVVRVAGIGRIHFLQSYTQCDARLGLFLVP